MAVNEISLYLDFKLDESYTPKQISIKAGPTFHSLVEIHTEEVNQPSGWITIPLMGNTTEGSVIPLKTFLLQIRVVSMHQNGRDTHVRQVKIYTPRTSSSSEHEILQPQSFEFLKFAQVR